MAWIIRNQFGRRNISIYQRAKLALLLKPLVVAEAKKRQARKPVGDSVPHNYAEGETREIIAKEAGVSRGTIDRVEYIEQP